MCYGDPSVGRELACITTVGEQRKYNVMVHDAIGVVDIAMHSLFP